jgi:hypothetical protein
MRSLRAAATFAFERPRRRLDAVFVVQLAIMQKGSIKNILIKNYMPGHPNAGSYYPPVLVKLLDEIQRIRPMNSFEKKNNLVLNLPT